MAEYMVKYVEPDGSIHTVGGFASQADAETHGRNADRDTSEPIRIYQAVPTPGRDGQMHAELVTTI